MACNKVKCSNPNCSTTLPACQTINKMCPMCYRQQSTQQKTTTDVYNKSAINGSQVKQ